VQAPVRTFDAIEIRKIKPDARRLHCLAAACFTYCAGQFKATPSGGRPPSSPFWLKPTCLCKSSALHPGDLVCRFRPIADSHSDASRTAFR
jgi:hypothetical protein